MEIKERKDEAKGEFSQVEAFIKAKRNEKEKGLPIKTAILINPAASRHIRVGDRAIREMVRSLSVKEGEDKSPKFSVKTVETSAMGDAGRLARELVGQGTEFIFAVGGDSTVREVAQVLQGTEKVMAVLPGGTKNILAAELSLPMDIAASFNRLKNYEVRPVDTGKVQLDKKETFVFVSNAGIGLDAHVMRQVHQNRNEFLPKELDVSLALLNAPFFTPMRALMKEDGQVIYEFSEDSSITVIVLQNHPNYAGIRTRPKAKLDDGALHLSIVDEPKDTPFHVIGTTKAILTYLGIEGLAHRQSVGKEYEIESHMPLSAQLDGEFVGEGKHITVSAVPASLNLLVPKR